VTEATEIVLGDPIAIPPETSLYVATGCWQCDGPTNSLERVVGLASGAVEVTTLRTAPISGFAVSPDGQQLAVSECVGEGCGTLGVPEQPVSTQVTVSTDGGATFGQPTMLEGNHVLVGFTGDELVVRGPFGQLEADTPAFLFPSMTPLPPPSEDAAVPFALPSEILWASPDYHRLYDAAGATLFDTPALIWQVQALDTDGSRIAMVTGEDVSTRTPRYQIGVVSRVDGEFIVEAILENPQGYMTVGGAIPDGRIALNLSVSPGDVSIPRDGGEPLTPNFVPALLDPVSGVAQPLTDPFYRQQPFFGRNFIVAASGV
jgi:hypothetical protein